MTAIQPTYTRKFVANMQKARADTVAGMETILGHVAGKVGDTGVAIFANLVDEANRVDAYNYVLRGFEDGSLPDGHTVETAPFEALLAEAEAVFEGLTRDMVQQARRPHRKTGYVENGEYFYTLGDILNKLEMAIQNDRNEERLAAKLAEKED